MFLEKSFTLLELVIVVVIVAVLAGFGISQMQKVLNKAHWAEAPAVLGTLRKACEIYYLENGKYPDFSSSGYIRYLNGPLKNDGRSSDIGHIKMFTLRVGS